jgi:hypothetical protein
MSSKSTEKTPTEIKQIDRKFTQGITKSPSKDLTEKKLEKQSASPFTPAPTPLPTVEEPPQSEEQPVKKEEQADVKVEPLTLSKHANSWSSC